MRGEARIGPLLAQNLSETRQLDGLAVIGRAFQWAALNPPVSRQGRTPGARRRRSGELDRLLDEDHAALVARAVAFLERHGWSSQVEATFQFDRESGSIDILATRRADGVALVLEVKTRLMWVEELLRSPRGVRG